MFVIVYFTPLLLFFHQTDAVTAFTSTPSNPSTAIEAHDHTLTWNYTLDGTVLIARFSNITGGGNEEIARKEQGGSIIVKNNNYQAGISDTYAWLKILKVQRSYQGTYVLDVTGTPSGNLRNEVEVIVQYAPTATIQQCSTPVTEGDNVTLYCNATGDPAPNIAWIRASTGEVLSNNEMYMNTAVKRNESGSYECHASNGIGNNSTKPCTIDVHYRPKIINLPSEYNASVLQSLSLDCQAEGNPKPSFTWTPCEDGCNNSTLVIPEVWNDTVYTCNVTNSLGSDLAEASIVIAGEEINITMTTSCAKYNRTLLSLTKEIDKVFANKSAYTSTTLKHVRSESLIVDLSLKFGSIVSEKWVLTTLKEAAKDGKLGECNVAASSIKGTRPVILSTTSPPNGKTTPSSSSGNITWIIVGVVLGIVVVAIIVAVVVVLCVRNKKKKSRKDNKEVSDKPGESHRMSPIQSGPSSAGYGNNGYENTGSISKPPAANAGKKDKKVKKKQDEPEKPVGVVYAQVDKSKKTAKPKEPENLYDQAARPNSKRPGELQYVAPEDLHQGHSMPRNSAAQPKRPEAYTETQYAVLV